ncbi:hypothetical protein DM02DRAFT_658706 [Periconia macrospinosa]|uniref:Uncharacterized protein n=1 Tax=Periconia macrospinosa TaxID=97972 RepID=A0A2V1DIB0_9PLEO|nr:hypothetical protein DM02DRAFT_658706 [Periconia macrospinosa]
MADHNNSATVIITIKDRRYRINLDPTNNYSVNLTLGPPFWQASNNSANDEPEDIENDYDVPGLQVQVRCIDSDGRDSEEAENDGNNEEAPDHDIERPERSLMSENRVDVGIQVDLGSPLEGGSTVSSNGLGTSDNEDDDEARLYNEDDDEARLYNEDDDEARLYNEDDDEIRSSTRDLQTYVGSEPAGEDNQVDMEGVEEISFEPIYWPGW